ncbi:MAG: M23 family metallopeptidase [Bacteroidales bacterium]|nr:M23 family metallopeptidase [Bacteroidales bacterium]
MAKENKEKAHSYRLSLADDNHRLLGALNFSKIGGIVSLLSVIVVIAFTAYFIFAFTPLRTAIPGYPDAESKRNAIQNAIKVDSLESLITRWEYYSENLRRVVEGQEPLNLDSLFRVPTTSGIINAEEAASKDSILRKDVKDAELFNVSNGVQRALQIEGIHFFTPLKNGTVTKEFDKASHPYIDLTAPANSIVMSVLEGTIIFAGWDDDAGYSVIIQHKSNILSIYKHNQKLLKKVGDKVSAGTPIALIGGQGNLTTGDHLHFELWQNGTAEDPTKFINFQ